ncbi:MAG TPA: hypothetical protein VIM94_10195 [Salegentibacter sp.]|uniref:hypothetical protein n=1 Tax=Salegentibacter sp. TaxID=1903072 RepID=UPI002F93EEE0
MKSITRALLAGWGAKKLLRRLRVLRNDRGFYNPLVVIRKLRSLESWLREKML